MDKEVILARIGELISPGVAHEEKMQGTASLLALVYGSNSPHSHALYTRIREDSSAAGVDRVCRGVLQNMKREIEAGLTANLRQQITGEILTDFIQLSRAAMNAPSKDAKNVAAVLAAAAFEDTIRRMGQTLAGATGPEDLSEVLKKLKDASVMQGPQVGIAQSYLSFRNHALHASWDKIEKEAVHSVLGFVEQLLLKHFD
jgi:hypothetical protein